MKKRYYGLLILSFLVFTTSVLKAADAIKIDNMRCEYRTNPTGIDVLQPRLSWILKSDQRGQKQNAYRVLVATSMKKLRKNNGDAWDTGKTTSSQSIHIYYNGKPLQSDRVYYWKVRIWDKDGRPSKWSETAVWTTGLLNESDWQAKWIGLDKAVGNDDPEAEHTRLSARMLRHEFKMEKKIKRATAFVCGLGLFEMSVNGKKIGDQVLAPGLTEYNKRALYMTFDVTKQFKKGKNAVGVLLGNGRYFAPRNETPAKTRTFGYPKLLLQINAHFSDGTSTTVVTDKSWKLYTDGPIQANNEYDGEIYDARKELNAWDKPGFDDSSWMDVELVDKPGETLSAQMNEPIKVTETIQPIAVSEPQPGVYVYDMGQNMVGWVRLNVKGQRGDKVTLKFAEVLNDDGMLYLDNIRGAKVTDVYILKSDKTETWEPRFTYHGFRYVEMRGFPGKPDLSAIEGKVVHDALTQTGTFSCSNPLINQIYKNAVWGIRGNYRSMPTDCPQRDERHGWLGDRSAESKGESYIFNIASLYNKWLTDIQDAQLESGSIPDVAPSYWPTYTDNTTWPGSYLIIPAMLYQQYGDMETLKRHYPSMKKWIEHMSTFLQDDIMPKDTYGDWCVPPKNLKVVHSNDPSSTTSAEFIGTAYFYHELELMQNFALLLNKPDDASFFQNMAKKIKLAFNDRFLDKNSVIYSNNSQTTNVLALRFGLVPEKYRDKIINNLVDKIMGESEEHIGTGLVGAQWLMQVLSDNGRPDIAYTLASQNSYPSWGYMAEHDATTIWELWNGDTGDPSMNSHNHVMLLGDFITWLYENLAGLKPDPSQPAFKHMIMRPDIIGDLDATTASFNSMYGLVSSQWKIKNKKLHWDITIPPNTLATVYMPAETENDVTESGLMASQAQGVQFLRLEKNRVVYELQSGQYSFTSTTFKRQTPVHYVPTPVFNPADTTLTKSKKISVRITDKLPGVSIHYTVDGTTPSESSPQYKKPIKIKKTTVLKARAFKEGYHPSIIKSNSYDFVDPRKNGVRWDMYRGSFSKLPDFENLKSIQSGKTMRISLDKLGVPDANFALVFTGYLDIKTPGQYTFYTVSNDGSQLFIDNKLLVDNDGEHGPTEKSGKVMLSPGKHPFKVTYFQSGGSKALHVYYQGPGIERQVLPGSSLYLDK